MFISGLKKRIRFIILIYFIPVVIFMIFIPHIGAALTFKKGKIIDIPQNEVIKEDLYIVGNKVSIEGTVQGSVWILAENVKLSGSIDDNLMVIAGKITLGGSVGKAAKLLGRTVEVNGNITRDLLMLGNNVLIGSAARVKGDQIFGGKILGLFGDVSKDVIGAGKTITVGGTVGGKVKVWNENLVIAPTAIIKGDLIYRSEHDAVIQKGAKVQGNIRHVLPEHKTRGWVEKLLPGFGFLFQRVMRRVLSAVMLILTGTFFVIIAPHWLGTMTNVILKKPWKTALWGVVLLFLIPFASIVLFVTIIGLPMAFITMFLYFVTLYVSQIITSTVGGRLVIGNFGNINRKRFLFLCFVVGVVIIRALYFIPIAHFAVRIAVVVFGLGSIVTSKVIK